MSSFVFSAIEKVTFTDRDGDRYCKLLERSGGHIQLQTHAQDGLSYCWDVDIYLK